MIDRRTESLEEKSFMAVDIFHDSSNSDTNGSEQGCSLHGPGIMRLKDGLDNNFPLAYLTARRG